MTSSQVVRRERTNAVIGLDLNVIVRYLAQLDRVQFAVARRAIEHALAFTGDST
jgi:hypothetical protein